MKDYPKTCNTETKVNVTDKRSHPSSSLNAPPWLKDIPWMIKILSPRNENSRLLHVILNSLRSLMKDPSPPSQTFHCHALTYILGYSEMKIQGDYLRCISS